MKKRLVSSKKATRWGGSAILENDYKPKSLRLVAIGLLWIFVISTFLQTNSSIFATADTNNFNVVLYKADLYTTEGEVPYNTIKGSYNFDSPSVRLVKSAQNDLGFIASVKAWETATFEPGDITEQVVDEIGYYETIIFKSLDDYYKSSFIKDTINNEYISNSKKMFSSFKSTLKLKYGYDLLSSLDSYDDPKAAEQAMMDSFSDSFKKTYPNISNVSKYVGIYGDIVKIGKIGEQGINNFCAYMSCYELNEGTKQFINDLYYNCDERENPYMKRALENINKSCQSYVYAWSASLFDVSLQGFSFVFDKVSGKVFDAVLESQPFGMGVKIGQQLGKTFCNFFFSTDKTIEQYYKMECLTKYEALIKKTLSKELTKYRNNRTEFNAETLFAGVETLFVNYSYSCELAKDFAKTIYLENITNIFGANEEEYKKFQTQVDNTSRNLSDQYNTNILNYWYGLLEIEYPDVYKALVQSSKVPDISFEKSNNSVKLTWTAVSGAEKYSVCGYSGGKWKKLAEGTGTSYTLKNLKAGTNYKVAVVAKFGGKWNSDFSNAITVTLNPKYPVVTSEVSGSQFRLKWTAVDGAEKYGIAFYQSGKWILKAQFNGNVTSYTSPKMSKGTYKMAVCAKVGGKWDTSNISIRAFEVTIAENNSSVTEQDFSQVLSLRWGGSSYIDNNGSLYTWGENRYGQLGTGDKNDRYSPVKIMSNVKSVSFGGFHSACITENGDLYTWGDNEDGKLGTGDTADRYKPVKIMSNVKSVSLYDNYSAFITENGDLYTWGSFCYASNYDHIGITPVKIMSNVKAVSICNHFACITENGDLYTWGDNKYGQLGTGETGAITSRTKPVKIMSNVKAVSLGVWHSACITENGDLYIWGWNYYGQLGTGEKKDKSKPVKVLSNVKDVSLGGIHSACITEDGDLYTWGDNRYGQLGTGDTKNRYTPVKIMSNVKAVSTGSDHSACITENGDLYTWGYNDCGELGIGTSDEKPHPTPICITDKFGANAA